MRLARIVLNAADPATLARFYIDALGFARHAAPTSLRLGDVTVDLVHADGRPYPSHVPGWSPLFQHFAIVVPDMGASMDALQRSDGWTAISRDGPERLPANTGGVTAFKFRDPEGHPLELLALPTPSPAARIDHSAISVADIDRSIAFYATLGLGVTGRSLNVGREQERLDGLDDACVDVVALGPPGGAGPHLELLGYRGDHDRTMALPAADDVAATRLGFDVDAATRSTISTRAAVITTNDREVVLRDPDGHLLAFRIGPDQRE